MTKARHPHTCADNIVFQNIKLLIVSPCTATTGEILIPHITAVDHRAYDRLSIKL